MSMTLQMYRDQVRGYFDLDVTDLSDLQIDMWVREGQAFILAAYPNWPHLYTTNTIVTASGVQTYNAGEMEVEGIQGPQWELEYIDVLKADSIYTPNWTVAGDPLYWGIPQKDDTGCYVNIYPKPTAVLTLTARGRRFPNDPAATASTTPDLPDAFHEILHTYIVYRGALQQSDIMSAYFTKNLFDQEVQTLISRFLASPAIPIRLNQGSKGANPVPPPLARFWFEPR